MTVQILTVDGQIDMAAFTEMSAPELKDWICERLLSAAPGVYAAAQTAEPAHYIIQRLYEHADAALREDVRRALQEILGVLVDGNQQWPVQAVVELLQVLEPVFRESDDILDVKSAIHTAIDGDSVGPFKVDSVRRASLQALVGLRDRCGYEFWKHQYEELGPSALATVFEGLTLYSVDAAIHWMGTQPETAELRACVVNYLPLLIEDYGLARIEALVRSSSTLSHNPVICSALREATFHCVETPERRIAVALANCLAPT